MRRCLGAGSAPLLLLLLLCGRLALVQAQRPPCPPPASILPCVCATRGEELTVWCTHSDLPKVVDGLKTIGEYISRPIDELIIEHNHLPALPGRAFRTLKALRLMLRHNSLERVAPGWLAGLEDSLMELFIVEDDLRSLPVDSVAHMKKLQAVTIESDQLKRLPSFSRLNNLRYLKVQSSSLIELNGRSFKHLPALEKLEVTGSPRLHRLESNLLHDLPRLSMVNISDCGLSWIHLRAMSVLPSLAEISFENNKISDASMVGRVCRELPALATLRLDRNHIDRLNEAAFVDLPALKELSISKNKIVEIFHGAFHKVPALKSLDLNHNIVQRVHPESFLQASASGLEELWLVGNEISHVSELRAILDALPRLKFLDMSRNLLEDIPYGAIRGHPTLERLHLDSNRIRTIEREAFMAMPALRELRLSNNSLSNHIDGPFWNLPALKGLDLSYNFFRRLEPRLITNLPSLRKVDLSQNTIAIIDPMTFLETPLLEHVNISGNSLASIHPATFRHLMGLYELDVSKNRLLEFVPGLPRGIEYVHMSRNQMSSLPLPPSPDMDLPSLRMLDISANAIRNIPAGVMSSLPQLRRLDISLNGLQHIEDGSFAGLARLEMLDLHNNMIMSINPTIFKDMIGLTQLDMHGNVLEVIKSDVMHDTPHLRTLDLSRNRLREVAAGALEHARNLEKINMSSNYLTVLPETFSGMIKLDVLDMSNNQLKIISPAVLSSLSALRELRMSNNKLLELKEGAFQDLKSLQILDLRGNELEMIHSGGIRTMPDVETILLSGNRLIEIPDAAFAELPNLKNMELQDNNLHRISNNAFYKVPQLQFMNLSNNQIGSLDSAGLRSVKSLEVLDISNNRVTRVGGMAFDNMEWLVELKMDNNKICAVQGSPFNNMPRLKVLTMRNNKMTSLPEASVKSLHSNIAVLDIDGNPLVCGCSMAWFRAWLQEASSLGPRCADGSLLKERKIYRQECDVDKEEPVLPGCEGEIIDSNYGTSQVFSPWMEKIRDQSLPIQQLPSNMAPSPEESEYFYDEYVDYPFNDTNLVDLGNSTNRLFNSNRNNLNSNSSYHFTPGDTPTLYAGQKTNYTNGNPQIDPATGGFTFFGMPIPSLNIGKLWGAGRKTERKAGDGRSRGTGRLQQFPPTQPDFQSGGFVPLMPGATGGFKPISNPIINGSYQFGSDSRFNSSWPDDFPSTKSILKTSSTLPDPSLGGIGSGIVSDKGALFNSLQTSPHNHSSFLLSPLISNITDSIILDPGRDLLKNYPNINPGSSLLGNSIFNNSDVFGGDRLPGFPNVDTGNRDSFPYKDLGLINGPRPVFSPDLRKDNLNNKKSLPTTAIPEYKNKDRKIIPNVDRNQGTTRDVIPTTQSTLDVYPKNKDEVDSKEFAAPSALSVLAVPGGLPAQHPAPGGRKTATITKVENPHTYGDNLQIPSSIEPVRASNRGGKTSFYNDDPTTKKNPFNDSLGWYYKNYNNQSALDPYVGPGVDRLDSGGNIWKCDNLILNVVLLIPTTQWCLSRWLTTIM